MMEFDNQYLTYYEYTKLGGTLEKTPFSILEFEAQVNVDNYTYGRLKRLPDQKDEVKMCIFNLIPVLKTYAEDKARNLAIASENIDGYSVTYVGITADLTNAQKSQIRNIIETYLGECKLKDGTPYLYIGR